MAFTGDTEAPSKNPFSAEYKEWISNIAADVARLNKLLPVLDYSDVVTGGGTGGGGNVFLAVIVGGGLGQPYSFYEIKDPEDKDSVILDGRSGVAINTLETGIETDPKNLYIPPGFEPWCFNLVFGEQNNAKFDVLPIAPNTIVHMAETRLTQGSGSEAKSVVIYSFSVAVPICISCQGA